MAYIGFTIDDEFKDFLQVEADTESRSLSQQVAHIVKNFFSQRCSHQATEPQSNLQATQASPQQANGGQAESNIVHEKEEAPGSDESLPARNVG